MTEQRFTMDNPNDWGFPITDNVTGKVYSCDSNILMKDLCNVVNGIVYENEQLKQYNQKLTDENDELRKDNDYFERKKEEFLGKWSVAHSKNIQLRQENEQLKQVIGEFVENPTQHNLWKLRTVLKSDDEI